MKDLIEVASSEVIDYCTGVVRAGSSRGVSPSNPSDVASTNKRTGWRCSPEIGPIIKIVAKSTVTLALSKTSQPHVTQRQCLSLDVSFDDDCGQLRAPEGLCENPSPDDHNVHPKNFRTQ